MTNLVSNKGLVRRMRKEDAAKKAHRARVNALKLASANRRAIKAQKAEERAIKAQIRKATITLELLSTVKYVVVEKENNELVFTSAKSLENKMEAKKFGATNYINKPAYDSWSNVSMSSKTLLKRKDLVCSTRGYKVAEYDIEKVGNKEVLSSTVVRQGENIFFRNFEMFEGIVNTSKLGKREYSSRENFTKDVVVIKSYVGFGEKSLGNSLYIDMTKDALYLDGIDVEKKDGSIVPGYRNLRTGKIVSRLPKTAEEYRMLFYTSSSIKEGKSIWYRANMSKTGTELLDRLVPGVISNASKEMSRFDAIKFASRPGLAWSNNNRLCKVPGVAVFSGEFDATKMANGIGNNTSDGQIYASDRWLKRVLKLRRREDANNLVLQARLHGVYKFQLIVVPHELLSEMISECKERGNVDFYGEEPVMLLDKNAKKADVNMDNIELSMMSMGKVTAGKTSKQLLEKVLFRAAADNRLEEIEEYIKEKAMDQIYSIVKTTLDPEAKEIGLNDEYVLDILGKIQPNNPAVKGKQYTDAVNAIAKVIDKLGIELTDGDDSMIVNGVVAGDISSIFGKQLIPDNAIVFGKYSKMLAKCEDTFGRDSEEYKALEEKFGRILAIKYPSMYIYEYMSMNVLNMNDMYEIVDASDLSISRRVALKKYFANISDATVMFPAKKEIFMLLAGMDTDFDKVSVVFDKVIVDLMWGKEKMLEINPLEAMEKKAKYSKNSLRARVSKDMKEVTYNPTSPTFFKEMYNIQVQGEGMIGTITFYNNRVNAIALECLRGNYEYAKYFLKEVVGETKGEDRAYTINRTIVSPSYVDDMIEEISTVAWTHGNILAFLDDCSKVFRLYQEATIDAAKTGVYLAVLLTVRTLVVDSLVNVSAVKKGERYIIARKEYVERTIEIVRKEATKTEERVVEEMTTKRVTDRMATIQDFLMEEVNNNFEELMEENVDMYSYTKSQISDFEKVIDAMNASSKNKERLNSLYTLKRLYDSFVADHINALGKLDAKASDYEERVAVLKEDFNTKLGVLSSSVRGILDSIKVYSDNVMNAKLLGRLALAVTCIDEFGRQKATSRNRFAYAVAPEYTYLYLVGDTKYTAYSCVLETGRLAPLTTVEVIDGVSTDGLVLADKYTGEVTFDEYLDDNTDEIVRVASARKELSIDKKDRESFTLVVDANKANDELLDYLVAKESVVTISGKKAWFACDDNAEFESLGTPIFTDVTDEEFVVTGCYKTYMQVDTNKNKKDAKPFFEKKEVYIITCNQ